MSTSLQYLLHCFVMIFAISFIPCNYISPTIPNAFVTSLNISPNFLWNMSPAGAAPNGSHLYLYLPNFMYLLCSPANCSLVILGNIFCICAMAWYYPSLPVSTLYSTRTLFGPPDVFSFTLSMEQFLLK